MRTIEQNIRMIFPTGTAGRADKSTTSEDFLKHWNKFPYFPPDLFAASAHLVRCTGAYTLVKPGLPDDPKHDSHSPKAATLTTDALGIFNAGSHGVFELTVTGHAFRYGLCFPEADSKLNSIKKQILSDKILDKKVQSRLLALTKIKQKKERRQHRAKIQNLWSKVVIEFGQMDAIEQISTWEGLEAKPLRKALLSTLVKLMIIADEACAGIGHYHPRRKDNNLPFLLSELNKIYVEALSDDTSKAVIGDKVLNQIAPMRYNGASCGDIARVVPKASTAAVGCTLRNLSQNVALAPIISDVTTYFENLHNYRKVGGFNVLLIPFPYKLPHNVFKASYSEKHISKHSFDNKWRWFETSNNWIPPAPNPDEEDDGYTIERSTLIDDLVSVILEAKKTSGTIHGIVLPELSIDSDLFARLADKIRNDDEFSDIELLIAGTCDALSKISDSEYAMKKGNFACTAIFHTAPNNERGYIISTQHKHHRWKLNREQIENHNCSHILDPSFNWWENINISTRRQYFWGFRENSVLTTIICEDLARIDPAQKVIREVGPNLIVALLMDGPQLRERWASTYANTLSNDPGSSVLTLTSLGLMNDRQDGGRFKNSSVIALWAEKNKKPREINMSEKAVGVVLNLRGFDKKTSTLDGRTQPQNARSWSLSNVKNVINVELKSKLSSDYQY